MKRRSREINIFSMSALDLFASALGAFILIAVVIFPYFPNTSTAMPAPPAPVCPVVEPCPPVPNPAPLCPPVRPCPPLRDPMPAPVCPPVRPCPPIPDPAPPATQFPHLDLVIALDVSGTMAAEIDRLKREVDQLSRVLDGLTPSFGLGVVAFGDRLWDEPTTAFGLREMTASNQSALSDFVQRLGPEHGRRSGSNPDLPEAFWLALAEAAGMRWRPNAELRVIVLITDNPAYPEERDRAISDAGTFAAQPGRRVSTVFRNTNTNRETRVAPGTEAFLRRVASAGNGEFVQARGSLTASLLLSMM